MIKDIREEFSSIVIIEDPLNTLVMNGQAVSPRGLFEQFPTGLQPDPDYLVNPIYTLRNRAEADLARIVNEYWNAYERETRSLERIYWVLEAAVEAHTDDDFLVTLIRRAEEILGDPTSPVLYTLREPQAGAEDTYREYLRLGIARSYAQLGELEIARDVVISLIDDLQHLVEHKSLSPFTVALNPIGFASGIGESLTLEGLAYFVYVIYPEFDAITHSELHGPLWDAFDRKMQQTLQAAIDRHENVEPYLSPANYVTARAYLAQREQLQPVVDRLQLR